MNPPTLVIFEIRAPLLSFCLWRATGRMSKAWRKVLWQKQPFGDNHVDVTFMQELVQKQAPLDFWELVRCSQAVTQHVSAIVLFLLLFRHLHNGTPGVSAPVVGALDCALLLLGYVLVRFCVLLEQQQGHEPGLECVQFWALVPGFGELFDSVNKTMLFAALVHVMAPVLRTLTKSYANDSIWALSFILTAVHLATHDFRYINCPQENPTYRGTLSFNAATFLTVLLASRLRSNEEVFAFVAFSIEVFAYFPVACHHARRASASVHTGVTAVLIAATMVLVFPISPMLGAGYTLAVLVLSFLGPCAMVYNQKYKDEITGPWDIATVGQRPDNR